MKDRINIYCEYAFWSAFFDDERDALKDRNRRKAWDCFFDFLCANKLFLGIAPTDIDENTCGGKAILDFRQATGGAGIHFLSGGLPSITELNNNEHEKLNSVFLTTKQNAECKELSNKFGVIVLNKDMVYEAKHLFDDCGRPFIKKKLPNWSYLNEYGNNAPSINCCNSLLIVDRYLFSGSNHENVFDNNLMPIFEALLPQKLADGIVFNICIFSDISSPNFYDGSEEIEEIIDEIRPKLNFDLKVIDTRRIHDRVIITNNIMLSCGAGFDVIGSDGLPIKFTNTSLTFPFLSGKSINRENYLGWIYTVLNEQSKCHKTIPTNHHILNNYYEKPRSRHNYNSYSIPLMSSHRASGIVG